MQGQQAIEQLVNKLLHFTFEFDGSSAFSMDPELVVQICDAAVVLFQAQSSLLKIVSPKASACLEELVIFGDLHGNLRSLRDIIKKTGIPPHIKYLGLGDYVNRGSHSVEVFILLISLSVLHPQHVYLLRGGHESEALSRIYGFEDELRQKGIDSSEVRSAFFKVFNTLPLAAVIDDSYFCVHGGISPLLIGIQDPLKLIREQPRGVDVPEDGLITDILYADPITEAVEGFYPNPRGIGYCFAKGSLNNFLGATKLKGIIRSREYIRTGFNSIWDDMIFNVFSSCDYQGEGEQTGFYKIGQEGFPIGYLA